MPWRQLVVVATTIAVAWSVSIIAAHSIELTVSVDKEVGRVNPLAFGNSVIYYGPSMGVPVGIRTQQEYETARQTWNRYLPLIHELGVTILRYPGGLLSNSYHWKPGIGPFEQRDPTYDSAKKGGAQIFGTDEFLQYCEELGATAIITVNVSPAGSRRPGTVQDAADWVEYCNAPHDGSNPGGGIDWAAVRAANGHREPYKVTYWELGNEEIYPSWQDYARRVRAYSQAMKAIDPSIKIGVIRTGGGIQPFFEQIPSFIEYQKFMIREAGDYFDFWSHHAQPPGANSYANGFIILKDGTSVETRFSVQNDGYYMFKLPVEATCNTLSTNCPVLRIEVDRQVVFHAKVSPLAPAVKTGLFPLAPGEHTVRLEATNIRWPRTLTLCQQIELYAQGPRRPVFERLIDLKDDPTLYRLVVSASVETARELELGAPYTGGKPVYITENGIHYREDRNPPLVHKVCDLREALSLASLYQMCLSKGIELMNYWFLFDDNNANGVLEGVAWNSETGEMARPDPHKRPSFHVLKALRWHVFDTLVETTVINGPSFAIGPESSGMVLGLVFPEETTVPYLQVLGSKTAQGDKVSLFVLNLDPDRSYDIPVRMFGFEPKPEMEVHTITGPSPAANNEKAECPDGECVTTVSSKLPLRGNPFVHTFPKHSLTVLVLYKKGSDHVAPESPRGLVGMAGDKSVMLFWDANRETDLEGYVVYRSRVPEGPFGNRINTLPVRWTGYLDATVDNGSTYYYAIKAVDRSGNESGFSNKVMLQPTARR